MEMTTITDMTAQPSAFVVPTLGGAKAAVCPQARVRRTDAFDQALAATGPRPWSPPIT
jgi:hypothetical protein